MCNSFDRDRKQKGLVKIAVWLGVTLFILTVGIGLGVVGCFLYSNPPGTSALVVLRNSPSNDGWKPSLQHWLLRNSALSTQHSGLLKGGFVVQVFDVFGKVVDWTLKTKEVFSLAESVKHEFHKATQQAQMKRFREAVKIAEEILAPCRQQWVKQLLLGDFLEQVKVKLCEWHQVISGERQ